MSVNYHHISVFGDEVIKYLQTKSGQNYIDCTLGGAGHAGTILTQTGPNGKLLGFELDSHACHVAQKKLAQFEDRAIVVCRSYVHLKEEYKKRKNFIGKISGIVLDLGLSSDQLDKANRGFSFRDHGSLDMRFDEKSDLSASNIILTWPEDKLVDIFREYGEVRSARRLAKGLVIWRQTLSAQDFAHGEKQKQKMIKTSTFVLAILRILNISSSRLQSLKKHPATTVFQALRIATNSELDNLRSVLPQTLDVLSPGGRLVVISFHSLEDRIVKHTFRDWARDCICPPASPVCVCHNKAKVKLISKKAIKATATEIENNPRSRSAILRVVEKI